MDTEPTHEIMPRCRFGNTDRTTHETLEPRPHMDVFACALLRMGCAKRGLRGLEMPLVGAPAIGREAGEVTRCQALWPWEKHVLLPSPTDRRQHCPPVMIKRMPEPPRLGLLADRTPHCIAFGGPPAAVLQRLGTTALDRHLRWGQALQPGVLYVLARRCLCLRAFMTVGGRTGNTRAVSRMPRACRAIATICGCTSGAGPT